MVEVFKTDVPAIEESHLVIESLLQQCSDSEINFDLEDKDKILRVSATVVDSDLIIAILHKLGYFCEVLPD
jgi:hypothetical protein